MFFHSPFIAALASATDEMSVVVWRFINAIRTGRKALNVNPL
ncbi:hypothetical protein X739_30105 [Mesorhizobium sp. LNHC220B00]|nr:hypothetical protein X739_30105 [Mesorhizobium sp. LNHC220B00]